jgi:hypothetical protein
VYLSETQTAAANTFSGSVSAEVPEFSVESTGKLINEQI